MRIRSKLHRVGLLGAVVLACTVAIGAGASAFAAPGGEPGRPASTNDRGQQSSQQRPTVEASKAPVAPQAPQTPRSPNSSVTPSESKSAPAARPESKGETKTHANNAATPGSTVAATATATQPSPGNSGSHSKPEREQVNGQSLAQQAKKSPAERALQPLVTPKTPAGKANQAAVNSCLSEELPKEAVAQGKVKNGKPDVAELSQKQVAQVEAECDDVIGDQGSYIVVFKQGVDARTAARQEQSNSAVLAKNRFTVDKVVDHAFSGMTVLASSTQVKKLRASSDVAYVEADGIVTASSLQVNPTWGLDRIDQRALPLDTSFDNGFGTGSGVTAYVIDTGIYAGNNEFQGRVASGYAGIADGQGTNDCNGHGTHVSGTIAGATYGVAKSATLKPVRVLDCSGSGTWSGVIAGIDWAAADHVAGTPAVANLSLGGGYSASVNSAVAALVNDGVTVAVAAGNSMDNACNYSPASTPSAITVGASTISDVQASFSNYGTCVDVYAPGVNITSSWNSGATSTNTISGTSMASPHVAGAAAQYLSTNPAASPLKVWSALSSRATTGALSGLGSGSANHLLFVGSSSPTPTVSPSPTVTATPTPSPTSTAAIPGSPTNVQASATSKGSAAISWNLPADGGSALIAQVVNVYDKNGRKVAAISVAATATTGQVANLRSRQSYQFTVAARNAIGWGPESSRSNAITIKSNANQR